MVSSLLTRTQLYVCNLPVLLTLIPLGRLYSSHGNYGEEVVPRRRLQCCGRPVYVGKMSMTRICGRLVGLACLVNEGPFLSNNNHCHNPITIKCEIERGYPAIKSKVCMRGKKSRPAETKRSGISILSSRQKHEPVETQPRPSSVAAAS